LFLLIYTEHFNFFLASFNTKYIYFKFDKWWIVVSSSILEFNSIEHDVHSEIPIFHILSYMFIVFIIANIFV
jgi:hypothetical protein